MKLDLNCNGFVPVLPVITGTESHHAAVTVPPLLRTSKYTTVPVLCYSCFPKFLGCQTMSIFCPLCSIPFNPHQLAFYCSLLHLFIERHVSENVLCQFFQILAFFCKTATTSLTSDDKLHNQHTCSLHLCHGAQLPVLSFFVISIVGLADHSVWGLLSLNLLYSYIVYAHS